MSNFIFPHFTGLGVAILGFGTVARTSSIGGLIQTTHAGGLIQQHKICLFYDRAKLVLFFVTFPCKTLLVKTTFFPSTLNSLTGNQRNKQNTNSSTINDAKSATFWQTLKIIL